MSFTVHCTHCQTEFPVDPDKVPEGGVRARCTNCEGIFRVEAPMESLGTEAGAAFPLAAAALDDGGVAVAEPPEGEDASQEDGERVASGVDEADQGDEADEPNVEVNVAADEGDQDDKADHGGEADAEVSFEADPMETFDEPTFDEPAFDEPAFDDEPFEAPVVDAGSGAESDSESHTEADAESEAETGFEDDLEIDREDFTFHPPEDDGASSTGDDPGFDRVYEEVTLPTSEAPDGDDWVLEQDEEVDPSDVEVDRLDTVEEQLRGFQDETYEAPASEGIERVLPGSEEETFSGYTAPDPGAASVDRAEHQSPTGSDEASDAPSDATDADIEASDPAAALEAAAEEASAERAATSAPAAFTFGKRDPHEKARRLARVLVSDMITYNPDRHTRALEQNTLRDDFEEEIAKSWQEYVDQVGPEIAESTDYWTRALNDVLAKGEELF